MALAVKLIRADDGTERVLVDMVDFQALVDAAAAAEYGLPDVQEVVHRLRAVLEAGGEYVDAGAFLEQYDAAHGSR